MATVFVKSAHKDTVEVDVIVDRNGYLYAEAADVSVNKLLKAMYAAYPTKSFVGYKPARGCAAVFEE
jgi:hypothetical protein